MGNRPARGVEDRFVPGDWNIDCSMCGSKLKAGEAVQNWQGMWRHVRCDEPRHPQDFVHAINAQEMSIPFSQKQAETFINICTFNGRSAIAGIGVAGCMIAGRTLIDPDSDLPSAMTGLLQTESGGFVVNEDGLLPIRT